MTRRERRRLDRIEIDVASLCMHQKSVTSFFSTALYTLLDLSDCHFSIFYDQKCLYSFKWKIMGICFLIFKIHFIALYNLDFITAHSSLLTPQMGSVTPLGPALVYVVVCLYAKQRTICTWTQSQALDICQAAFVCNFPSDTPCGLNEAPANITTHSQMGGVNPGGEKFGHSP